MNLVKLYDQFLLSSPYCQCYKVQSLPICDVLVPFFRLVHMISITTWCLNCDRLWHGPAGDSVLHVKNSGSCNFSNFNSLWMKFVNSPNDKLILIQYVDTDSGGARFGNLFHFNEYQHCQRCFAKLTYHWKLGFRG